ncbi:MAG: hypothetical protein ED556_12280 [Winogradskyella sp.]|uniref:hypothetical protein n=1 Tax=Winogradskyella sp. TaxID=1883156 RepID=UPI000F3B1089|nr:hypothetical protein [Winogradskyella sp.]RNC84226.1 MAG: hypothetical protein ED556_12280 [Winogradskyella sp.]
MTSGQRKAHKIIWLALVVVIPVFMFFSIKGLNFDQARTSTLAEIEESKSTILKATENDLIKTNLYKSHMEVILKAPLKTASAIVYEVDTEGKRGKLLGQLKAVGIYKFNITDLPNGILVYDKLKDIEITKLKF